MTILIGFQLSHYRTFKDFYLHWVCIHWKKEFPALVSYNRFVELTSYAFTPLMVLTRSFPSQKTGKYFVDSTKLAVCHTLRIGRHQVFKGISQRGKTSTGWFFGFKLHLVINDLGELVSFCITGGNRDDRSVVGKLTAGLQGWLFGDRGYISAKLFKSLELQGLKLMTRIKRNMNRLTPLNSAESFFLSKRGVIESVIGWLKLRGCLEHSRHRSIINFFVNVFCCLLAYILPKKPSVRFHRLNNFSLSLMSN